MKIYFEFNNYFYKNKTKQINRNGIIEHTYYSNYRQLEFIRTGKYKYNKRVCVIIFKIRTSYISIWKTLLELKTVHMFKSKY